MRMEDYGGDWNRYVEALYLCFSRDFVADKPTLNGRPFKLKRHPMSQNKECTFWHVISEGEDEESRIPDMRRCERLCWIRPLIESVGTDRVLCWNQTTKRDRILVALPDFSFKVVVADRGDYLLLWTAYCLEYEHQRHKLKKDFEKAVKTETGLAQGTRP